MFERKHLNALIFCAIMVSMPFVQAFSTAAPGRYVIYLDKDQSITQAMATIQEKIPDINRIAYGSTKYHLLSHRIIEPLVWVGHGDKEGINSVEGKITWEALANDLLLTPTKDIVLACYSSEILKHTSLTGENIITFDNEIDSILGGLITSYLLTGRESIIMDAALHYRSILKGEKNFQPLHELDPGEPGGDPAISQMLQEIANIPTSYAQINGLQSYVFYKMSGIELVYHFMAFIILVIELVLACTLAPYQFTFLEAAIIDFMTMGVVSFLTTIAYYSCGIMTESECIDEMVSSFSLIGQCIYKAYCATSIWEQVAFWILVVGAGVVTALELFCDVLSAGAVTAIRIIVSITLVALFIYDFVYDLCDDDYLAG